eukprot:TRINITY_DN31503_c0_g1_i1.p2 TRINITY_DN31503_c0_g1~~TRINITY_DN31503_c0_g1_i1.p2  ORF type:complete len:107 (-),score=38.32 TRINITY_DN31503_c0_g1_i1:211-531(-)
MGQALTAKPAKQEPCQEEFDRYMRCVKDNEKSRGMLACDEIMEEFQRCMRAAKQGSEAARKEELEKQMPAGVLPEGQAPSQHVGPRSLSAGLYKMPDEVPVAEKKQ